MTWFLLWKLVGSCCGVLNSIIVRTEVTELSVTVPTWWALQDWRCPVLAFIHAVLLVAHPAAQPAVPEPFGGTVLGLCELLHAVIPFGGLPRHYQALRCSVKGYLMRRRKHLKFKVLGGPPALVSTSLGRLEWPAQWARSESWWGCGPHTTGSGSERSKNWLPVFPLSHKFGKLFHEVQHTQIFFLPCVYLFQDISFVLNPPPKTWNLFKNVYLFLHAKTLITFKVLSIWCNTPIEMVFSTAQNSFWIHWFWCL